MAETRRWYDQRQTGLGEAFTAEFKAADFNVSGYQFTLNFDRTALELVEVMPGLADASNFGGKVDKANIGVATRALVALDLATGARTVLSGPAAPDIAGGPVRPLPDDDPYSQFHDPRYAPLLVGQSAVVVGEMSE